MIVKNESAIIRSTLENLTTNVKFSYWVICDTGSTDGTQDIIRNFFAEKKIQGELHEDKWENFGHNRTLALERAYKKSDYVLIFDADDAFRGNFKMPKFGTGADLIDRYSLKFGFGSDFSWYRPVILNNQIRWKYFGVLHEYVDCVEPNYNGKTVNYDGDYYIEARTIGGDRNKDDKKYYKDAILLEKALESETDPGLKSRYTFYCAQSFRDYLDLPNAIKYYKLRTTQGNFDEEIHVSYFNAGKAMIALHHAYHSKPESERGSDPYYSEEEIERLLLEGWNYMKDRSECLCELAKFFRMKGNYTKAYVYAKLGVDIPYPQNRVLFVYKDVYTWRLKDEVAICSYYLGKYDESIKYCQKIMRFTFDERILSNMKFSVNEILKRVLIGCQRTISFSKNRLTGLTMIVHYTESLDFVKILMNSLFYHAKDIYLFERFLLVVEESKVKQVEEIKSIYPIFEFVTWKHPSHILPNIKEKLNRHDRFIFETDDSWIAIAKKNYFTRALSMLNMDKNYGQLIYNRVNANSIDQYADKVVGTVVQDPETNDPEQRIYYMNEKFKLASPAPSIYKREFFDSITSYDKPIDENHLITLFQNQIDFVRIKKQITV